jgi:hypothetical protein
LVNYLFHQDNICYVIEFTHEIIPKNEIEQKARELADSCEPIDIDNNDDIEWVVTKESLNPTKKRRERIREKRRKISTSTFARHSNFILLNEKIFFFGSSRTCK